MFYNLLDSLIAPPILAWGKEMSQEVEGPCAYEMIRRRASQQCPHGEDRAQDSLRSQVSIVLPQGGSHPRPVSSESRVPPCSSPWVLTHLRPLDTHREYGIPNTRQKSTWSTGGSRPGPEVFAHPNVSEVTHFCLRPLV